MFQRFFDEGLAQASFVIGCDRNRRAGVPLAASPLAQEGFTRIANVSGGMAAYREAGGVSR